MVAASRVIVAWLVGLSSTSLAAKATLEPLPGLRRVIVFARHGNRAPDLGLEEVCKPLAQKVLPAFDVEPGDLSHVGMAQNRENGNFLRHRYQDFLSHGPSTDDCTFCYCSKEPGRNADAAAFLAQGLFRIGKDTEGFAHEYLTSCMGGPGYHDANDDRYGTVDEKKRVATNEARVYGQHKELFRAVADACGPPLEPGKTMYDGKPRSLTWRVKTIMDALRFSEDEGVDATIGLNASTVGAFREVAEGMLHDFDFGQPHMLIDWVGDVLPMLLSLAHMPLKDKSKKLHVLAGHREKLYAASHMLGLPIAFPGERPDSLPPGSSLLMEVYDGGVRFFFWSPSRPSPDDIALFLARRHPTPEPYEHGVLYPLTTKACGGDALCPVESLVSYVLKTGMRINLCSTGANEGPGAVLQGATPLSEDGEAEMLFKRKLQDIVMKPRARRASPSASVVVDEGGVVDVRHHEPSQLFMKASGPTAKAEEDLGLR